MFGGYFISTRSCLGSRGPYPGGAGGGRRSQATTRIRLVLTEGSLALGLWFLPSLPTVPGLDAVLHGRLPFSGAGATAVPGTNQSPAARSHDRRDPRKTRRLARVPVVETQSHPVAAASSGGGWGYDISWPQCDGDYPSASVDFAVVGVTDGRPFSSNPCLGDQARWASHANRDGTVQLYMNIEIGAEASGVRRCGTDDHVCRASNYGAHSADDAVARADREGAHSQTWWLDVEVASDWSDTPEWNAAVVQGAIDRLHSRGILVGIYSSPDQWGAIVGAYRPAVPTWLAVVGDQGSAPSHCDAGSSLTGGPVRAVQYSDDGYDQDYLCPGAPAR